jgi:hypothetical protein
MERRNRFKGIDFASWLVAAGRYDIPTRFLAPEDCSKIPAQVDEELLSLSQDYAVKKG